MGKYDGTCLTCDKLQVSDYYGSSDLNGSRGEIRCSHHGFVNPWDKKCSSYSNAYRSDDYIRRCLAALDKKMHYYIVSSTLAILGMNLDCDLTKKFEEYSNYLRSTQDGEKLMLEYDIYGKMVGDILRERYISKNYRAETLYITQYQILPKLEEILKEPDPKRAIMKYIILTRRLMKNFGIEYYELNIQLDETKDKSVVSPLLEHYKTR